MTISVSSGTIPQQTKGILSLSSQTLSVTPPREAEHYSDERPMLLVGAVWIIFGAALVAMILRYGVNLPKYDEWLDIVPYYTGDLPVSLSWLTEMHGGHRLVLSRLVQLVFLKATGDFRAGMFFNAGCLWVASLILLVALRKSRTRPHTRYSDVAVPLILLTWAHFDNVLWSYQIQYLLSVVLVSLLFYGVSSSRAGLTRRTALLLWVCLLLLPLCGFNGLIWVPCTALWLAAAPFLQRSATASLRIAGTDAAGPTPLLSPGLGIALAFTAFVFAVLCAGIGQVAPGTSYSLPDRARTFFSFLQLGFGVAGIPALTNPSRNAMIADLLPLLTFLGVGAYYLALRRSLSRGPLLLVGIGCPILLLFIVGVIASQVRPFAVYLLPAAVLLSLATAFLKLVKAWESRPGERFITAGLAALLVSALLMALALSAGRGNGIVYPRYVTLAALTLVVLFCTLDIQSQQSKLAGFFRSFIVCLVIALAPVNFNRVRSGLPISHAKQMRTAEAMRSGITFSRLITGGYQLAGWPRDFMPPLLYLKRAGQEPFRHLREDAPPRNRALIAPEDGIATGAVRLQDGSSVVYRASAADAQVRFVFPHPIKDPLINIYYAYTGITLSTPPASIVLQGAAGEAALLPPEPVLTYFEQGLQGPMEYLGSVNGDAGALVIKIPKPGTGIRLDKIVVWN
ncbi:MAG: hypothetical protein H7Z41_12785 [Cytophagales bacterium]|nr:hypothetical protein [Armatimonadota bacterium]